MEQIENPVDKKTITFAEAGHITLLPDREKGANIKLKLIPREDTDPSGEMKFVSTGIHSADVLPVFGQTPPLSKFWLGYIRLDWCFRLGAGWRGPAEY